jgi:hypothetical protein
MDEAAAVVINKAQDPEYYKYNCNQIKDTSHFGKVLIDNVFSIQLKLFQKVLKIENPAYSRVLQVFF